MKFISNILKSGDIWGAPDGVLSMVLAEAAPHKHRSFLWHEMMQDWRLLRLG